MRWLLSFLPLLLCSCAKTTEWYAPPIQREPLEIGGRNPLKHFIAMSDPAASLHFVRDVSPHLEGGVWRWTFKRPELRFYLDRIEHLKFSMDFTLPPDTYKVTGPVTLSVFVNGKLLDKARYDHSGNFHYEKPVPSNMLSVNTPNNVAVEPDKVWTSPDGGSFGFVLARAGFLE